MTTPIKTDVDGVLICPGCECDYLHQKEVDIYNRDGDSSDAVFHLKVEGWEAKISHSAQSAIQNPSPRRDGLTVNFSCEECGAQKLLQIIQHKGRTYLSWID